MHKHTKLPIVVLGAGLAGLSAAYTLKKNNVDVIVLEARERVGGRVWTKEVEADKKYHIEMGGEWIGKQHHNILHLIKLMNLQLLPHKLDPSLVIKNKYLRKNDWEFSQEWKKKFTEIINVLKKSSTRKINSLDKIDVITFLEQYQMPLLDLEIFALLQRSMYGEDASKISAYDAIIDNYINGNFVDDIEDYYIKGGNSKLPQAFVTFIGEDKVLTNHIIKAIRQRSNYVEVECTNGSFFLARRVVCALPTFAVKNIQWFPHFPIAKIHALNSLRYSRVTKNSFLFREKFWENNFHVLTEDVMCEVFHATQNQGGKQGILTGYVAGDLAYAVSRMDDKERMYCLRQALFPIFGKVKGIEEQYMYYWGDDPYTRGAYSIDQPSYAIHRRELLCSPHLRVEFAGEHLSTMQGYMEGAVETGIQAAHRCLTRRT